MLMIFGESFVLSGLNEHQDGQTTPWRERTGKMGISRTKHHWTALSRRDQQQLVPQNHESLGSAAKFPESNPGDATSNYQVQNTAQEMDNPKLRARWVQKEKFLPNKHPNA
jgi:hypothetical protein